MRKGFNFSILLLTILTIQFGCNSGKKNIKESVKPSNTIIGATNINTEDFKAFILRFKADSLFQYSRIRFPLVNRTVSDNDEAKDSIIKIDSKHWRHIPLEYDPAYATRKIDAYTEKSVISGNSARLLYQGVDNGIDIEFIFELKDNNWYLTNWNDLSD